MTRTALGKRQANECAEAGVLKVPNLELLDAWPGGITRLWSVLPNPIRCSISNVDEAAVRARHEPV